MDTPQTELVSVIALKRHPRNYKTHPDDQIEHLIRSISEHGFYRNVVIARDNTILAGHGVVQAVERMGLLGPTAVPCVRLDLDADDPRALKIMTSDNELGKFAESNDRALTDLLKEIAGADDLLGTGFDAQRLAALAFVTRPESEIKDFDEAAEWVGMPEYEPIDRHPRVTINFESEADRELFLQTIGATFVNKKMQSAWLLWWPERRNHDMKSVKFIETTLDFES